MKNLKTFESFSLSEFESGYYPAGTEFNPDSPWNREDPKTTRGVDISTDKQKFNLEASDYSEFAILKKKDDGNLYAIYFEPSSDEFRDFMEVEMELVGRDEDGDPDYEYDWENAEVDTDAILAYATDKLNSEGTGKGMYDWESDKITLLDPEIAEQILGITKFSIEKMEKAGTHTTFLNRGKYQDLKKLEEVLTTFVSDYSA